VRGWNAVDADVPNIRVIRVGGALGYNRATLFINPIIN